MLSECLSCWGLNIVKHLAGVSYESRDGIDYIYIDGVTREVVDSHQIVDAELTAQAAATTGHSLRLYVIQSFIMPTPYMVTMTNQSVSETPDDLYESFAIVVSNRIVFTAMATFLNRRLENRARSQFRVFKDEAAGRAWLQERRAAVAALLADTDRSPLS